MAQTTRYFKIIAIRDEQDGSGNITFTLKQVADYLGTALDDQSTPEVLYTVPAAQEKPRGTVVKVVDNITRTFTVNPTS